MTVFVNQSNLDFLPKENRMPLSNVENRMLENLGVSLIAVMLRLLAVGPNVHGCLFIR